MADLVTVATLEELRNWLISKKIPTGQWGKGQMKAVEDLWSELGTGESVLIDRPPSRRVSCVSLVIRCGDKQLLEVGQELANGETRQRRQSPAEKMLPDEDPKAAAFRCVEEELGISRELCRIVPGVRPKRRNNDKVSPSYPGLKPDIWCMRSKWRSRASPGPHSAPRRPRGAETRLSSCTTGTGAGRSRPVVMAT